MSTTIDRARKALERDLRQAEESVAKLKAALRAMQALNGHGQGVRLPAKGRVFTCACGTRFRALRSDATYCAECRKKRKRDQMAAKRRADERAAKKGTTIIPGAR
jgi:hypothetical protein